MAKDKQRTPDDLRSANLSFDLALEEVPVEIGGDKFILRELDGTHRDKYLNDLGRRLKTVGAGKHATQTVNNFDGLQSGLLAKCLFDADGNAVAEGTIQKWPARVVSKLFDAAKELSDLGEDDEDDEEGNDD